MRFLFAILIAIQIAYSSVGEARSKCFEIFSKSGAAKASRNTDKADLFYNDAFDFASIHGVPFGEFVLARRSETGKTVIAVVMGGAEHLGTLLKRYVESQRIPNVEVVEVWLNRSITGYWVYELGFPYAGKVAVGIEGKPRPYPYEIPQSKWSRWDSDRKSTAERMKTLEEHIPRNSMEELVDYTTSLGVWTADKVLVVDTGFKGGMADGMAVIAKQSGYTGSIEGTLFSFSGDFINNLKLPISGYTDAIGDTALWAYSLDTGQSIRKLQELSNKKGNRGLSEAEPARSFQRSRPKASQLIRNSQGRWEPDTAEYTDPQRRQQIEQTRLGVMDGLDHALSQTRRSRSRSGSGR